MMSLLVHGKSRLLLTPRCRGLKVFKVFKEQTEQTEALVLTAQTVLKDPKDPKEIRVLLEQIAPFLVHKVQLEQIVPSLAHKALLGQIAPLLAHKVRLAALAHKVRLVTLGLKEIVLRVRKALQVILALQVQLGQIAPFRGRRGLQVLQGLPVPR